jgi:two-component system chemotaxis response regulator CheB
MPIRDIIVIGASAGGLEALQRIAVQLPADLPAAIFVVTHLPPRGKSFLAEALAGHSSLPARQARDGEQIEAAKIYVAAPDQHLLLAPNHVHLTRGPKEGLHRPSINATFRSAAAAYGPRVIGVLLSGMLDDGAAGLWEITTHRGVAVVQDPGEAPFPSMPLNALHDSAVDYTLSALDIGKLLPELVRGTEIRERREKMSAETQYDHFSGLTCPECRGPLYERSGPGPVQFRCRVGHVLALKTLLDEHTSVQERKLYEAVVALEEGADLALYTATRVAEDERESLKREGEQLRRQAGVIRKLLEERETVGIE